MLKQIFKRQVPLTCIYELFEKICNQKDAHYFLDINAYKKMIYYGLHTEFITSLLDCYHVSKRFYLTRKLTYQSFTTIIRQICKSNNIVFTSHIKYTDSKYNIEYHVLVPTIFTNETILQTDETLEIEDLEVDENLENQNL